MVDLIDSFLEIDKLQGTNHWASSKRHDMYPFQSKNGRHDPRFSLQNNVVFSGNSLFFLILESKNHFTPNSHDLREILENWHY